MSDCKHERTWRARLWLGERNRGVSRVCRDCGWSRLPSAVYRVYPAGSRWELLPPHPAATEVPPGYAIVQANAVGYADAHRRAAEEGRARDGEMVRAERKGRMAGLHGRHVEAMAIHDRPCAGREDAPYPDDADLAEAWREGWDQGNALREARRERDADRAKVRALVETLNANDLHIDAAKPLAALRARMATWPAPAAQESAAPPEQQRLVDEDLAAHERDVEAVWSANVECDEADAIDWPAFLARRKRLAIAGCGADVARIEARIANTVDWMERERGGEEGPAPERTGPTSAAAPAPPELGMGCDATDDHEVDPMHGVDTTYEVTWHFSADRRSLVVVYSMPEEWGPDGAPTSGRTHLYGHAPGCLPGERPSSEWACVPGCPMCEVGGCDHPARPEPFRGILAGAPRVVGPALAEDEEPSAGDVLEARMRFCLEDGDGETVYDSTGERPLIIEAMDANEAVALLRRWVVRLRLRGINPGDYQCRNCGAPVAMREGCCGSSRGCGSKATEARPR